MLRAMTLTLIFGVLTGAACAQGTSSLLGVASEEKAAPVRNAKTKASPDNKLFFGIDWKRDAGAGIGLWVAPLSAAGFRIKQVEYRWQPLGSEAAGPDAARLKGGTVVSRATQYWEARIDLPAGWRFDEGVQATERDATGVQMAIAARVTIMPVDGGETEVVRIVVRSPAFRPAAVQASN